jgi:hypothetical protein
MSRRILFCAVIACALAAPFAVGAGAEPSTAASASGSFTYAPLGPDAKRIFSFEVQQLPDGSVSGRAATRSPQGTVSQIALNCLILSGNQAIVGGTITNSTDPNRVGISGAFAIQDNPDRISFFLNNGDQSINCGNLLAMAGEADITSLLTDFGVPFQTGTITIAEGN